MIQRYTPDFDRTAVETALKQGGYPGFVTALRKAPEVVATGFRRVETDQTVFPQFAADAREAEATAIAERTDRAEAAQRA